MSSEEGTSTGSRDRAPQQPHLSSPQRTSTKSSSSGISSTPTKNTGKMTFLANNNASVVKYAEKKGVDRKILEIESLKFQSKILELMEALPPDQKRQREKAGSSTVTDIIESVVTGSTIGEEKVKNWLRSCSTEPSDNNL